MTVPQPRRNDDGFDAEMRRLFPGAGTSAGCGIDPFADDALDAIDLTMLADVESGHLLLGYDADTHRFIFMQPAEADRGTIPQIA